MSPTAITPSVATTRWCPGTSAMPVATSPAVPIGATPAMGLEAAVPPGMRGDVLADRGRVGRTTDTSASARCRRPVGCRLAPTRERACHGLSCRTCRTARPVSSMRRRPRAVRSERGDRHPGLGGVGRHRADARRLRSGQPPGQGPQPAPAPRRGPRQGPDRRRGGHGGRAVRSKLAQPIPLGYSSAGIVVEVGPRRDRHRGGRPGCRGRSPCRGRGRSRSTSPSGCPAGSRRPMLRSPPSGASGSRACAWPSPRWASGSWWSGSGLVGLLTVQLLQAQGCPVLGIDPNPERASVAEGYGAVTVASGDDVLAAAAEHSAGRGVDGVLDVRVDQLERARAPGGPDVPAAGAASCWSA